MRSSPVPSDTTVTRVCAGAAGAAGAVPGAAAATPTRSLEQPRQSDAQARDVHGSTFAHQPARRTTPADVPPSPARRTGVQRFYPMLTRPRFKAHLQLATVPEEGVFVLSGTKHVVLRG